MKDENKRKQEAVAPEEEVPQEQVENMEAPEAGAEFDL